MSCKAFAAIDEYLAVGVAPELLPGQHRHHLEGCPDCQAQVEESRVLARLLDEPLMLPPADLTARIMARVAEPRERPLPQASPAQERLLWASLGAAAASVIPFLQGGIPGLDLASWMPVFTLPAVPGLESSWALAGAVLLLGAQITLQWGVRRTEAR